MGNLEVPPLSPGVSPGVEGSLFPGWKKVGPVGLDLTEPLAFTGQVLLLFGARPNATALIRPYRPASCVWSFPNPIRYTGWSVEALQLSGPLEPDPKRCSGLESRETVINHRQKRKAG